MNLSTFQTMSYSIYSHFQIAHVTEDIDNQSRQRVHDDGGHSNPIAALFKAMWSQTQPLFNRDHIRNTILICFIQFWIFVTSNGMYMWFPYILNSVAEFMSEHPNNRTYICDVVYAKQEVMFKLEMARNEHGSSSGIEQECNEKLEISTYQHSLILEVMYAVGFALIGGIINKVGKSLILCKFYNTI